MRTPTPLVRPALLAGAMVLSSFAAQAADINPVLLTQAEFKLLSEDLGSVVSFKPLIPAESMGITGFDIGIAVTGTKLQNRAVWEKAASGSSVPSTLPVPMLRVHKGLPFNIDIGASYSKVPSTNIQITGGELRWAFVPGGVATPALAVRASVSSLSGVDRLKLRTTGFDVSLSKGFAFLTPYVGAGTVRVKSTPDGAGLARESFSQSKVFGGLNLNFGLTNLAFEADKTGQAASYGVKFGLRF
jgi:hypothetical protein